MEGERGTAAAFLEILAQAAENTGCRPHGFLLSMLDWMISFGFFRRGAIYMP